MPSIDRKTVVAVAMLALLSGCATTSDGSGRARAPARIAEPEVHLASPKRVRTWDELRVQVARRIVAANPNGTYDGPPPPVLLAIPVLEIELNANGSVRRIKVLRKPGQAFDTTQIAIDAVHRAAPFGDISHLPKPWTLAEVFLFQDDRRFKPRTLDN